MKKEIMGILSKTKEFIRYYFKRYSVLAGSLSVVCFLVFALSIIPANAVLPSGGQDFEKPCLGGVQVESAQTFCAQDVSIPRNAAGERLKYAGNFKVTHYCACTICTWGSGITASGKPVADGMIAAGWKVLPRGTHVYLKRGDSLVEKVVEDTGGAIQGNKIDIYVPSHSQALAMGVYYVDLYVDPDPE
jgi:3D (Asp-Asp-Asp) domain-containing protein